MEEGCFCYQAEGLKHLTLIITGRLVRTSSGALRWARHAHHHGQVFLSLCQRQAAGEHHWSHFGCKQLAVWSSMFYEERSLGRGRQRAADFLGPLRHAVGELFVAAAQETWISSSTLPPTSPSSPSSVRAGSSLERDRLFLGGFVTVLQVDSWPLWLLSCYQAMPSLGGSGKVPPSSLAAGRSGAMLLAPVQAGAAAGVGGKCQTVPGVHSPTWQGERCNKKFLIFAPARLRVQSLQFVLVFWFFPPPDYCQVFHIDTAI